MTRDMPVRAARLRSMWAPALALLVSACGRDETQPLDGGVALDFGSDPESEKLMARDPCWRRENGGWHYSIGHCEPMLPSEKMQGVFVTAFEERSFFPDATAMPDPDDPTRYATEIELDRDQIARRIGREPAGSNADAIWLRFVGRRMRDPYHVDCYGTPYWVFVVDRLLEARFLGEMKPARWPTPEEVRRRPVTVAVRHKGRWGEEEAEAVEFCQGPDPKSDRIEDVDQSPSQARPPGRSSAE